MFHEEEQTAKVKIVSGSYSSLKKLSWKPRPVTPLAPHWLSHVTWSTLAARESGSVGYQAEHVGTFTQIRATVRNGWSDVFSATASFSTLPSFILGGHMVVQPPHFLVLSHRSSPPPKVLHYPKRATLRNCCPCFSAKLLIPQRSVKKPTLYQSN